MMKAARTACKTFGCAGLFTCMGHPQKASARPVAINANYLSIWFAQHWPEGEAEVTAFLSSAAKALGGREADLARYMGVSRPTLSSWKTRGAIPESHTTWFFDEFPYAVLSNTAPAPGDDLRHAGLIPVLHLLKATSFNPFGLPQEQLEDAAVELIQRHLPGLARLALFVSSEEHTSDTQSPTRTSISVFRLQQKHKTLHTPP